MPRNVVAPYRDLSRVRLSEKLLSIGMTLHRVRTVDEAARRWKRIADDLDWVADRLAAVRKSGADVPEDLDQVIGWIEHALSARMWSEPGGAVLRDQARGILTEIRAAVSPVERSLAPPVP